MDKPYYSKLKVNGMTYQEIADLHFNDTGIRFTKQQVRDRLKRAVKAIKQDGNRPTLVFSDTHFPYHREGYLDFLKEVYAKYNCSDEVICCGDLVDHHAISRHDSEPDAVGDVTEFDLAMVEIQKLVKAFPNMVITFGNHDKIPERQAKSIGLSPRYMKSFNQLWQLPSTVRVVEEYEVNGVIYQHGIGSAGKDGAVNTAIKMQSSFVQGHTHAYAGVKWAASKNHLIFGMNAGCLCDPKSIAMAYGKVNVNRPTLGCGVIHSNHRADWIPFVLE